MRSPTLDMASGAGIDTASSPEPTAAAVAAGVTSAAAAAPATVNAVPPKVSVNVLNDIGNMLANLTDELDAMLEEEKRVGLNIDSE